MASVPPGTEAQMGTAKHRNAWVGRGGGGPITGQLDPHHPVLKTQEMIGGDVRSRSASRVRAGLALSSLHGVEWRMTGCCSMRLHQGPGAISDDRRAPAPFGRYHALRQAGLGLMPAWLPVGIIISEVRRWYPSQATKYIVSGHGDDTARLTFNSTPGNSSGLTLEWRINGGTIRRDCDHRPAA